MEQQYTPMQFIDSIRKAIPRLSESELAKLKKQAGAWATVFYEAEVPEHVTRAIATLEVNRVIH